MTDIGTPDMILGGLAIAILIGGLFMLFSGMGSAN